jgi:Fe-S cluster biosynthesis and repair protein YggX
MVRMVHCAKLGKELPGLKYPPFKDDLGRRIFETISEEAWKMWLKRSTMVINEFRINPAEAAGQKIMRDQVETFLFGGGTEPPPEYVPPNQHHR